MGWLLAGGSQRPDRRVINYGTSVEATAQEAEKALTYWGVEVYLDYAGPVPAVCCVRRGRDRADAELLLPGGQLVVGVDGGWRIEPAPAVA